MWTAGNINLQHVDYYHLQLDCNIRFVLQAASLLVALSILSLLKVLEFRENVASLS